ncbi:hypothetical protein HXX76_010233 [Chlamydomonas incerta]|uniref:RWP-RK domain-containing protein n=1 Tax=Chlamydomonas incerta TaxID=51695 RepID=A0A835SN87_CHLIN|nr:hypothetical protein HXX76_010233 [Chlamydomonas incerta]|eukprot:KAG2430134.1 hypothetical protein HXX76_010233 [Chlamydomonas incerta]
MLDTFDSLVAGLPMLMDDGDGPSLEDLLLTGARSPRVSTGEDIAEKMALGTSDLKLQDTLDLLLTSYPDLWMADGGGAAPGGNSDTGAPAGGLHQRTQQQQQQQQGQLPLAAAGEEGLACSGAAPVPAGGVAAETLGDDGYAVRARGPRQQLAAGLTTGGGAAAGLSAAAVAPSRLRIVASSQTMLQQQQQQQAMAAASVPRSASAGHCGAPSLSSQGAVSAAARGGAVAPLLTPAAAAIARLMSCAHEPPAAPVSALDAAPTKTAGRGALPSPRAVADMPAQCSDWLSAPAAFPASGSGWDPRPMPTPAEVLAAAGAAANRGDGRGPVLARFDYCLSKGPGVHCISDPAVALPCMGLAGSAGASAHLQAARTRFPQPGDGISGGGTLPTSGRASSTVPFAQHALRQPQSALQQLPAPGFGDAELSPPPVAAAPLAGGKQYGGGGFLMPGASWGPQGAEDFLDWGGAAGWGSPVMPLPQHDGPAGGGSHSSLQSPWSAGVAGIMLRQGSEAGTRTSSLPPRRAPLAALYAPHDRPQPQQQATAAAGGDAVEGYGSQRSDHSSVDAGDGSAATAPMLGRLQLPLQQQQQLLQREALSEPMFARLPDGGVAAIAGRVKYIRDDGRWPGAGDKPPNQRTSSTSPDRMDLMLTSLEQMKLLHAQQQGHQQRQQQQLEAGWSASQAHWQQLQQRKGRADVVQPNLDALAMPAVPASADRRSNSPTSRGALLTAQPAGLGVGAGADATWPWLQGNCRVPLGSGLLPVTPSSAAAAFAARALPTDAGPCAVERHLGPPPHLGPPDQQLNLQGAGPSGVLAPPEPPTGIGASGTFAVGADGLLMPLVLQLPQPDALVKLEQQGGEPEAAAQQQECPLPGGGLQQPGGAGEHGPADVGVEEAAAAAVEVDEGSAPPEQGPSATTAAAVGSPRNQPSGARSKAAQARAKARAAVDWPLPAAKGKSSGGSSATHRNREADEDDEEWTGPVAVAGGRRARSGQDPTLEDLKRHYEVPIKQAATALGYSLSCFKQVCRRLGVPRWPARKLLTLRKMRGALLEAGAGGTVGIVGGGGARITPAAQAELLAAVRRNIADIYAEPDAPMYPEFTRVRQLQYKSRTSARRHHSGRGRGAHQAAETDGSDSSSSDDEGGSERHAGGSRASGDGYVNGAGGGRGGVVKRRRFRERRSLSRDEAASEMSEDVVEDEYGEAQ